MLKKEKRMWMLKILYKRLPLSGYKTKIASIKS